MKGASVSVVIFVENVSLCIPILFSQKGKKTLRFDLEKFSLCLNIFQLHESISLSGVIFVEMLVFLCILFFSLHERNKSFRCYICGKHHSLHTYLFHSLSDMIFVKNFLICIHISLINERKTSLRL